MRKGIILLLLLLLFIRPVSAMAFNAPTVPESAEEYMPADTQTFAEGLWYVIKAAIAKQTLIHRYIRKEKPPNFLT